MTRCKEIPVRGMYTYTLLLSGTTIFSFLPLHSYTLNGRQWAIYTEQYTTSQCLTLFMLANLEWKHATTTDTKLTPIRYHTQQST